MAYDLLSADVARVLELAGDDVDPLLREMTEYGRERGFPIVGPEVGRTLRLLARLVGARRVFEFGSGFGYSAAWFADALPDDGEIVLTDYDADNLAAARSFLERGGYDHLARYETGDATESFRRCDGPFDVVLIDVEKEQYVDVLELALPGVADGGLVVADNAVAGPMPPVAVRAALEGDASETRAAGIAEFLEAIRDRDDLETVLLPLGEGISVSRVDRGE